MTSSTTTVSKEPIVWGLLIIIVLFAGLVRYRLIDVPLERDEGEYAYTGQLILEGIPPYEGVYSMKLPGIYAAYALLLAVFGQTHQGIHLGLLLINSVTILMVFLLARHLFNSLAGIVSAASFAVLSVSQCVQGVFANAEHFVILFSTAGLLLLLKGCEQNSRWKLFVSGILLALGFTMKQHGVMFCGMAIFIVLFNELLKKPVFWRKLTLDLSVLSIGMMSVLVILVLILALTGVFDSFWFWTFDYAKAYLAQIPFVTGIQVFRITFLFIILSAPFIWVTVCFGFFSMPFQILHPPRKLFIYLYCLFSFLSICPGLYFRPHYFVLILPCASLLAGTFSWRLWTEIKGDFPRIAFILFFSICVGHAVIQQYRYLFKMTPFEVCRSTYRCNPFHESPAIATYLQEHTEPQDTIAILGSEPQIFFYSKRRSASGQIYMYPLMEPHDFALQMQKDFIRDIEEKTPKYIIDVQVQASWAQNVLSNTHIIEWKEIFLRSNYTLSGMVEIYEDKSIYHWDEEIPNPSSKNHVLIYKRNNY